MNYRHAYHAGNFADCMKHVFLCWVLSALSRKSTPFLVVDTHAGTGETDLNGIESQKTGEWKAGIGRLLEDTPPLLQSFVDLVQKLGLYPGSPKLARSLMRPDDRLILCEKHPEDCDLLKSRFERDRQTSAHHRDGYEALRALLPSSPLKRGLVLIDPPFEDPREFDRAAQALKTGSSCFPGTFMIWYPIKARAPVRAFHHAVQDMGLSDVVVAELYLREPVDPTRLNGSGLLIRRPPFGLMEEGPGLLTALLDRLGTGEDGEGTALVRLADE